MTLPIDTRQPIGKLDFDTEDRKLPPNHYRYAKNGRSGTSDKDGDGASENIRGNVLRNSAYQNRGLVIGSCSDVKNNAVIYFVFQAGNIEITYTTATVTNTSPAQVSIVSPSETLPTGTILQITQGLNVFVGKVTSQALSIYQLSTVSGSLTTDPITKITRVNSLNRIERYYDSTGIFENLTNPTLMGDVLNFSATTRIYNPRVIESSFGQLLTWTDGVNPPRLMNIDKMKSGGAYYSTAADEQYINLAKVPPHEAPNVVSLNNGSNINNLNETFIVFRYRYYFTDGEISTFSPISETKYLYQDDTNNMNAVDVSVDFNVHPTVSKIQIIYRFSTINDASSNVWYQFNITDIGSLTDTQTFRFEQITTAKTISSIDTDKNFENVPQLADTLEVVNNSQIVLGSITEGYDNVEITGMSVSAIQYIANMQAWISDDNKEAYLELLLLPRENDILYVSNYSNFNLPFPETTQTEYVIPLSATLSGSAFVAYLISIGYTGATITGTVVTIPVINSLTDSFEAVNIVSSAQYQYAFPPNQAQQISIVYYDEQMRSGGANVIGNYFFENLQPLNQFSSTVETIGAMQVVIGVGQLPPSWAKYYKILSTDVSRNRRTYISYPKGMNKLFLVNATGLSVGQIVEWNNLNQTVSPTTIFEQAEITEIELVADGTIVTLRPYSNTAPQLFADTQFQVSVYNKRPSDSSLFFEIGPTFDIVNGYHQGNVDNQTSTDPAVLLLDGYGPTIYKKTSVKEPIISNAVSATETDTILLPNGVLTPLNINTNIQYQYTNTVSLFTSTEYAINRYGVYNYVIKFQVAQSFLAGGFFANIGWQIRVNGVAVFSFGVGVDTVDAFVGDSRGFRYGVTNLTTNFNLLLNPTDLLEVVVDSTIGSTIEMWVVESTLSYNKTASLCYSQQQDAVLWQGRTNIETPNQKRQKIGTLMRWGGVLINNTQVNNLNVFDSGNYNNVLNARFGDITGMRQIGYTLKILQWSNINSAFLGRKELQNNDGSTNLVVTDSLIGTINPSPMEYGTKYAGSIISTGRRVYYYDSIKSRFIVDDGNGVNEVAQFQLDGTISSTMSQYFRTKSSVINADPNYEIITGFDYLYRDLYLTFLNRTTNTQETLYYNEDENGWKYFMDMESRDSDNEIMSIIDCYGNVGQSFFGFLQANTYQFNKLEVGGVRKYSTLFKVNSDDPLKPFVVQTIGMIEPDKVKIMQSHWIHCNKPIELVEITIPATTMYPNGMYTVLKAPNFAYREGVYYADIKNDMYTNGIPSTEQERRQAIANGRKMRGHVCLVKITYVSDDYVKLYSTGIGMIPSELS